MIDLAKNFLITHLQAVLSSTSPQSIVIDTALDIDLNTKSSNDCICAKQISRLVEFIQLDMYSNKTIGGPPLTPGMLNRKWRGDLPPLLA